MASTKHIDPENEKKILEILKTPKNRDQIIDVMKLPRTTVYDMLHVLIEQKKIDTYKKYPQEIKRGAPMTMFCLQKHKIRIAEAEPYPGTWHVLEYINQNPGRLLSLHAIYNELHVGDHRLMAILDHLVRKNLINKIYVKMEIGKKRSPQYMSLQMVQGENHAV